MPRLDYRATDLDLLPKELRGILTLFLEEINTVRAMVIPPLPPLTKLDLLAKLKQHLRRGP